MTTDNESFSKAADADDISKILDIEGSSGQRKHLIKWAVVVTIVVIASLLFWWFGDTNSNTVRYETTDVKRGNLTVTVTATGSLEPVNQVEVGSEVSGTIETVAVDFNDSIKQGQVLAALNTDQLKARVDQAQAALQLAQSQVKQAEATVVETKNKLGRAKDLATTGMCSPEDCDIAQGNYDRAEANLLSAKAQVFQAMASLDAEQTTFAKATIHSPINGIVLQRSVEPGQTVAASLQTPVLFILAEDLTQMELHVDVDEADVGQVEVGNVASFTVDAYPDRSFPAKITEVHFASQTVDGVVSYETVLRVDNSELLLRPGMTATADIIVNKVDNVLLVSNSALRFVPKPQTEAANQSGGGLLNKLIPHRPSRRSKSHEEVEVENGQRSVWALQGGQAVEFSVTTGSTDGIMTEVVGGDIYEGMALVVDTVSTE